MAKNVTNEDYLLELKSMKRKLIKYRIDLNPDSLFRNMLVIISIKDIDFQIKHLENIING